MKPLTIEELKALPVGEWVWVKILSNDIIGSCGYYQITDGKYLTVIYLFGHHTQGFEYRLYGTKWIAFKNKEQAEAKDDLYQTAFELILQDVYENRLQADTLSCSSCPFMFELFDGCENQGLYEDCKKRWQDYYLSEAERRLAELRGEK